jgi:hypothetical protein
LKEPEGCIVREMLLVLVRLKNCQNEQSSQVIIQVFLAKLGVFQDFGNLRQDFTHFWGHYLDGLQFEDLFYHSLLNYHLCV